MCDLALCREDLSTSHQQLSVALEDLSLSNARLEDARERLLQAEQRERRLQAEQREWRLQRETEAGLEGRQGEGILAGARGGVTESNRQVVHTFSKGVATPGAVGFDDLVRALSATGSGIGGGRRRPAAPPGPPSQHTPQSTPSTSSPFPATPPSMFSGRAAEDLEALAALAEAALGRIRAAHLEVVRVVGNWLGLLLGRICKHTLEVGDLGGGDAVGARFVR